MPNTNENSKAKAPPKRRVQVRDLKSRDADQVRGGGTRRNLISDCQRA